VILASLLAQAIRGRKLHVGKLEPSLQKVAVFALSKRLGLVEGEFRGRLIKEELGVALLKGKGEDKADLSVAKGGELPFVPPKVPQFVLDFSLWNELTDEERRKTLFQVEMTIATIRKYLWEGNLRLANVPEGVRLRYRFAEEPVEGECVVLDPKGDIAREEDLREAEVYVVGAIVDKGRRLKDATARLAEKAGYDCPRLRITLFGSVIGVPDEINKIVDIVMRVRLGEGLNEAVLANASKSDLLARVRFEESRGNKELVELLRSKLLERKSLIQRKV